MVLDRRTLCLALGAALTGFAGPAAADRGRGRGGDDDDRDDDERDDDRNDERGDDRRRGRDRLDHDDVYDARRAGEILPLRDILPIVEDAYPGEILSVEFEMEDGRPVYEFKVLQRRGRYLELYVDARTGAILEVDGD